MVIAVIFLIHLLFMSFIGYKRKLKDGIGSAIIDLIFIIIVFSVGWSLTTMFSKIFWEPIGFGKYFDRDTISLTILTVMEYLFYGFYFKDLLITEDEKEIQ